MLFLLMLNGTGTRKEVVIGACIGGIAALIVIGCGVYWSCKCYHKRHRRTSDAKKITELLTEKGVELGEVNGCA